MQICVFGPLACAETILHVPVVHVHGPVHGNFAEYLKACFEIHSK